MAILMPEKERAITALVEAVRAVDLHVRDMVLIGSAVYAPDLARDYDVVVTSNSPPEKRDDLFGALLAALNEVSDKNVDVILRFTGDRIGDIARAILAGCVLFGNGETITEARRFFEDGGGTVNSFNQAESAVKNASFLLNNAELTKDPGMKDWHYRDSFNALFNAARVASLTYLGREDTNWSGVARELPWPHSSQFREMIKTLHVLYSYDGNYPKDPEKAREEFEKWKDKVERFVGEMRERTLERDEDGGHKR